MGFDWSYPYSCADWSQTFGLTYPLLDGSNMALINDFNVTYIPFHVIIDHTMTIRYAAFGWNEQAITDTIAMLLGDIAVLGTPAQGVAAAPDLPNRVALHPAYPNPFNPAVTIAYTLAEPSPVRLDVFDLGGRQVASLGNFGRRSAGRHEVVWDARDRDSGVYILRLQAGATVRSQKIVLLK